MRHTKHSRLLAVLIFTIGFLPALFGQGLSQPADPGCTVSTVGGIKAGATLITYGSGIKMRNSTRRTRLSIGQLMVESSGSGDDAYTNLFGFWGGLLVSPLPPLVKASQGELLDRIRIEWEVNPLGSYPLGGFKLYRDGDFLALVDKNTRTFNDYDFTAGQSYKYEVRGINNFGEGPAGSSLGFLVPNGVVTGWVGTKNGNGVPNVQVTLDPMQGYSAKFGQFDGAVARADTSTNGHFAPTVDTANWSLSFWVKTRSINGDAAIMQVSPSLEVKPTASGIRVVVGGIPIEGDFKNGNIGDWHHVALTFSGGSMNHGQYRLYLDGDLVGLALSMAILNSPDLNIGENTTSPGSWEGLLDDLRMYHRRLDEVDLLDVMTGTASSLTPGLKYYWKMDEGDGTKSFDVLRRNTRLHFCGAIFDEDRAPVATSGTTNSLGFYKIDAVDYKTGTTFLATPKKSFYKHKALKFIRNEGDYALLPDFPVAPKATLELWVSSAGPDGTQCLLSKAWPGNDFQLLLDGDNNIKVYFSGQEHTFGALGLGYQHLAVTLDTTTTKDERLVMVYQGGALLGSQVFSNVTGDWLNDGNWVLGARPGGMGYTDHFDGLIDEVALYDTTLSAAKIGEHGMQSRDMQEKGLRVYFPMDEGFGSTLSHAGSFFLTEKGALFGTEWTVIAPNQVTTPHVFAPALRFVTLNKSVTSVDKVDFEDISTIAVSGVVRYKNTDCNARGVEILVNGKSYDPKIVSDSTGRYVIDFEPGASPTLKPVYKNHTFFPDSITVNNLLVPLAQQNFSNTTTRTISGQVAGGECKKSIINNPGSSGGTFCTVRVRTINGCLEQLYEFGPGEEEGKYLFEDLPPLVFTVAVTEHSDPAIKTAFQVQGGLQVDMTDKPDTVANFTYFAPPQVIITSGLDTLPCGEVVVEQYSTQTIEMKVIEEYYGGVCELDTAALQIINGFDNTTVNTTMSKGKKVYNFEVLRVNPSPPYQQTLQIVAKTLNNNESTTVKQGIAVGIANKLPTFATKSPILPMLVLHDPPGDGSYAYIEKGQTICNTIELGNNVGVGGGPQFNYNYGGTKIILSSTLNGSIAINAVAGTGTFNGTGNGTIVEEGTKNSAFFSELTTKHKIKANAYSTCTTINERISTDDGDLVVGDQGGDVFMGRAWNFQVGFADLVQFDTANCIGKVETVLNVEPDSFKTIYVYSEWGIRNNVIRILDALRVNPQTSPADALVYSNSIKIWNKMLDDNQKKKDNFSASDNISFDAGVSYEHTTTISTDTSETNGSTIEFEGEEYTTIGSDINEFGSEATVKVLNSKTTWMSTTTGDETAVTVGYVFKDDDPVDFFSVDVGVDRRFDTPIFRTKAGQSSCPWEPKTANREAPNLKVAPGSQVIAIDVPPDQPAIFNLILGNLSASNEDWTYGLTAIAANNPHGAVIKVNGQPLNNNLIKYIVPYGQSVPITLTVERGPVEYDYDNLLVGLVSECEMNRNLALSLKLTGDEKFFSPLYLGAHFIRPCSEVAIHVPEQNWVIFPDPKTIADDNVLRITVTGYDKSNEDFDTIRVQYRRTNGDGAWINIVPPEDSLIRATQPGADIARDSLGPIYTQFYWDTQGLKDDDYEIHAWAICSGDASDQPGYSQVIKGRIEREPPKIIGTPEPSDGVYHVGDEISFSFNKDINCIQEKIDPVNNVLLFNTETNLSILLDITCKDNKIILNPRFDNNEYIENRILRSELHGIEDLVGNVFNGTKLNLGVWEFYVDRNELAWLTDRLDLTKFEDENKTATAHIHNRGGYPTPFKILGVPDWVHVSPNQGTLAPNEIRPISFSVDSTLAFGHWRDTIILETQTGQNPFFMGGSEPLPLGVRVVCRPPYGPTDFSHFANAMGMVLKVKIDSAFSADPEDMVAAYIDDELRGLTKVQYFPQINAYLAYLNVYGDSADLLQPVRLEVWDASECERYGSVQESFTFQPDNIIGILTNPQIINTGGLLLREVPIKDGWNWLSFNLAFPDNSLNAALSSLQHPENDLMRSQTAISQYLGGWFGSLPNLNNTAMYIYRADVADTLRMQGTLIDPATPIPLAAGWNWVGYVPNYALPINVALASLPAQFGDIAKGQYSFAQYINPTFGWVGTLKYMSPPNGYQIKLAQADTLKYPDAPAALMEETAQARGETETPPAHWSVNARTFEHTNTLIGMLRANGANATTSDMELGAFAGDEVRGTAQAIYIEPLDAHLFFLTTYANTPGELLRFKLYNDADGTVRDLTETMYFAPNQHQGNIENPVPFELLVTSTEEDFGTTVGFDVQPNPFSSETTLRFNLPKAEEVTLTISDAQGREVVRKPISAVTGPNVAIWNGRSDTGSWLSSGVYTVRLQTTAGSVVRKVVLQRLP